MKSKTLACSGLLVVLVFLSLFLPLVRDSGLAGGQDTLVHVGNVVECSYLLSEQLPPLNWLPDIAGGRGGPNFIYYGSVGFLVPASLVRLGIDPTDSIRIWTAVVFLIGFLSAALWCSRYGGWLGGLVGGLVFVYAPYYYCLPYARGGYPEHFAYSLYPLVLHFGHSFMVTGRLSAFLLCTVILSLVVGSHTLSLAFLLPAVVVYLPLASKATTGSFSLFRLILILGIGAVVMSPSLLGPLFQTGKVVLKEQLSSSEAQDFYSGFGVPFYSFFNKASLGDIVSRCVPGRVHLLCIFASLVLGQRIRTAGGRRMLYLHVGLSLFALLLVERTVAGISVKSLPVLAYLQFPWRFLGLFNLFCAAAAAGCFAEGSTSSVPVRAVPAAVVPLLCLLVYFPDLPAMKVLGVRTKTREGIRASLTTLDHENKYMPVGSKLFDTPAPRILLEVSHGDVVETRVGMNDYSYSVNSRFKQEAKFHQYWFDGWRAEVAGRPAALKKDPEGLCILELPSGTHHVRLRFARTLPHRVALGVSLAAWTCLLGALCLRGVRLIRRKFQGRDMGLQVRNSDGARPTGAPESGTFSAKE